MKFKKLFIFLLVTATLLSILTISISANDADIQISEDYSTITFMGEVFILVGTEGEYYFNTDGYTENISLTETQAAEIYMIEAYTSDNFVELYIEYNKGGSASYSYVHEDLIDQFYDFALNGGDTYEIELYYGSVIADRSTLFGKAVTIKGYELNYYYYGDYVSTVGFDGQVSSVFPCGYIFGDGEGNIYYFDHGLSPSDNSLAPTMNETLTVWQITDAELIAEITNNSFENQYGDLNNDMSTGEVPLVLAAIIFAFFVGIIPLVGAIVCFITSLRADGIYKKCMRIASALLAATALITIITVIIIIALA